MGLDLENAEEIGAPMKDLTRDSLSIECAKRLQCFSRILGFERAENDSPAL
jgi:hypothetical protein